MIATLCSFIHRAENAASTVLVAVVMKAVALWSHSHSDGGNIVDSGFDGSTTVVIRALLGGIAMVVVVVVVIRLR